MGRRTAAILVAVLFAGSAPAWAINVDSKDDRFAPVNVSVEAGGKVVWVNTGENPHTVTADDGSFDSFTMLPGERYTRVFTVAGTVAYYCTFHGAKGGVGMAGSVRVTGARPAASAAGATIRAADSTSIPVGRMATTGAERFPLGGLSVTAVALIALGAWLSAWERIVRPGPAKRR